VEVESKTRRVEVEMLNGDEGGHVMVEHELLWLGLKRSAFRRHGRQEYQAQLSRESWFGHS
jgi:hypothetical protein